VLPVLKYGVARLVLFVVCVIVLGLLGAGRVVALFGGLLISVLLSYVLLRRLRDPATAVVAARVEARSRRRRATRAEEDALIEDQQVEEILSAHPPADAPDSPVGEPPLQRGNA
jgi:Protein of unknown function (DUF4229)